jgi:hypothetical protein
MSEADRAKMYRRMALDLRQRAAAKDKERRELMLNLANEYEALASQIEPKNKNERQRDR